MVYVLAIFIFSCTLCARSKIEKFGKPLLDIFPDFRTIRYCKDRDLISKSNYNTNFKILELFNSKNYRTDFDQLFVLKKVLCPNNSMCRIFLHRFRNLAYTIFIMLRKFYTDRI